MTVVAIDLGTTWTAAASLEDGSASPVSLSDRHPTMPSVVARVGGDWLSGDAAARALTADPTCGAREVKRRFGDTTPMIIDGEPFGAERLQAELLRSVLTTAPAGSAVVLTHPANWGDYKLDLLRDAARVAGCGEVTLISEPAAAAVHFAAAGRLAVGERIATYDLGGGTFDAAVVELTADGPMVIGTPEGLERFGGLDIDQLVFAHVVACLDGVLAELDSSDPQVREGIARLRSECTAAKEALSADSEVSIPVVLPGLDTEVRMTRSELEGALRPRLDDTLAALDRAIASAGLNASDLAAIVLVGGSSRIPVVSELVSAHTGRPTRFDAEPKLVVAMGAALSTAAPVDAPAAVSSPTDTEPTRETTVAESTPSDAPTTAAATPPAAPHRSAEHPAATSEGDEEAVRGAESGRRCGSRRRGRWRGCGLRR
ncbi:MAG: Hsp70 family protein [Ilumatobacteraceae bacterium]